MSRRRPSRLSSALINDESRLFIQDPNTCCPSWIYASCVGLGDLAMDSSEDEYVYCPSDTRYGEYDIIHTFVGTRNDASLDLTAYFPRNTASIWKKLYNKKCRTDWQIHFGDCDRPNDFQKFNKALLLYDAKVTGHTLTALGALTSEDRGVIQETVSITCSGYDEVLPLEFVAVRNPLLDLGTILGAYNYCDGECCICEGTKTKFYPQVREVSNGCYELWMVYDASGAWGAFKIGTCPQILLPSLQNAFGLNSLNGYHSIILSKFGQNYLNNRLDIINHAIYSPPEVIYDVAEITPFYVGIGPLGKLYLYNQDTQSVEQLVTHGIPELNFYSIDAHGDEWIIGGDGGNLYIGSMTSPHKKITTPTNQIINHVQYLDYNTFFITDVSGHEYKYCNGIWVESLGINGTVSAIKFANRLLGYAVANTTSGTAIYRTVDGGGQWHQLNVGEPGNMFSPNINLRHIDICTDDINDVIFSGRESLTPLSVDDRINPVTVYEPSDSGIVVQAF